MAARAWHRSIAFRIWLPFAAALSLTLVAIAIYYPTRQAQLVREATVTRMKNLARVTAVGVEIGLADGDLSRLSRTLGVTTQATDFAFVALVADPQSPGDTSIVIAVNPDTVPTESVIGATSRYLTASSPVQTEVLTGHVVVAASRERIEAQVAALNRPVYQFLAGLLLLSLIGLAYVARMVAAPTTELTAVAEALRDGRYDVPVRTSWQADEPEALAASLLRLRDTLSEAQRRTEEYQAGLLKAKQAAEAADRAKGVFVANISHEVRTPINAVLGLAHLCLGTPLSDGQRDYLTKIDRAARGLLGLVNDVLDFSKLEEGALVIEQDLVVLDEVLKQVEVVCGDQARIKGLRYETELDPRVPAVFMADALRLQQVIINLVGNAVKFTPWGAVRLVVRSEGQAEQHADLRIEVVDSGIGLTQEQLGRLFTPFTQADASTTRLFGGTGLGLAISQRLVTAMGGTIEVESVPGGGSRFGFTVRVGLTDRLAPRNSGPRDAVNLLEGCRILLVEDNGFNRLVVQQLLERAGASVVTAEHGGVAVDLLSRERRFDVILMDVQMPVMDGIKAARLINAQPGVPPIVAMTANVSSEDRERCREAGMVGFIGKPVDPERLAFMVESYCTKQHMEKQTPERGGATVERPAPPAKGLFDAELLFSLTGRDPRVLGILVDKFARLAATAHTDLEAALAAGDLQAVATVAHRFKSAAGQVGATEAQQLAAALERIGRDGGPDALAAAEDRVRLLVPLLGQLSDALQAFVVQQGTAPTS